MSETIVKIADAPKCPDWCLTHSAGEGNIEHSGIVGSLPTSAEQLNQNVTFSVTASVMDYFEPPIITRAGPYLSVMEDRADDEADERLQQPVMSFNDVAALREFIAAATALADQLEQA